MYPSAQFHEILQEARIVAHYSNSFSKLDLIATMYVQSLRTTYTAAKL